MYIGHWIEVRLRLRLRLEILNWLDRLKRGNDHRLLERLLISRRIGHLHHGIRNHGIEHRRLHAHIIDDSRLAYSGTRTSKSRRWCRAISARDVLMDRGTIGRVGDLGLEIPLWNLGRGIASWRHDDSVVSREVNPSGRRWINGSRDDGGWDCLWEGDLIRSGLLMSRSNGKVNEMAERGKANTTTSPELRNWLHVQLVMQCDLNDEVG